MMVRMSALSMPIPKAMVATMMPAAEAMNISACDNSDELGHQPREDIQREPSSTEFRDVYRSLETAREEYGFYMRRRGANGN